MPVAHRRYIPDLEPVRAARRVVHVHCPSQVLFSIYDDAGGRQRGPVMSEITERTSWRERSRPPVGARPRPERVP